MKENNNTKKGMKDYLKQCINFKVNVWRPLVAFVFLGSILTGCVDSTDNPVDPGQETATGDDASDKMPFKVTQTIVNNNGKSTSTVALRYYEDMPHVAYIAVADFQNMLVPRKSLKVSKTAASQYVLTTSKGETATVNTADEKMTFEDFSSFVSLSWTNAEGFLVDGNTDEYGYYRVKPATAVPATASVTFAMKKYGIDLRGDGQMVYVPLSTLSDIYSYYYGNHVIFNGEKIMLTTFEETPAKIDEPFFRKVYELTERPQDLAAYSYGELCFAIDHFYGRPGRNAIDQTIEAKGLDQALNETARKLLKSTNMNEYAFGLEYLSVLLGDGHTTISPIINCVLVGMKDMSKVSAYMKKYVTAFASTYPSEAKLVGENINRDDGHEISAEERKKLFGSDYYKKIGNTMYFIFDDFGPIDSTAWKAYYKGTGSKPTYNSAFKGDILGLVESLDKAAADPEVKNFVVDLTCNNGGDAGVLVAMTKLLAGRSTFNYEDVLTKQRCQFNMVVDSNFDRSFDDKDKGPRYPGLNVAIMTSHYAFSCGNLLPSLMKDYGYLIIGEKSGGGSCTIQRMCTPEGFCYLISSRQRLNNMAGENIDKGVEPHIALEVKMAKGKNKDGDMVDYRVFTAFYDKSVGDKITNWYKNKK